MRYARVIQRQHLVDFYFLRIRMRCHRHTGGRSNVPRREKDLGILILNRILSNVVAFPFLESFSMSMELQSLVHRHFLSSSISTASSSFCPNHHHCCRRRLLQCLFHLPKPITSLFIGSAKTRLTRPLSSPCSLVVTITSHASK